MMYENERQALSDICHLLYNRNLVTASDGNVSVRVGEHIILTPSGRNKLFVMPEDMLIVDMNGNTIEGEGKPSKEFPMHKAVYEERSDVVSVVHTHPVYATAFALAHMNIPENYLIESTIMLGDVALAEYAQPGSVELAENVRKHVKNCNAVLLENHGVITYGKSLIDAYNKMEVVESIAKTIIMSYSIGKPLMIPDEEMAKMKAKKK